MPQPFLIALCASSSLDQASNNFSLFGLIERVSLPRVPSLTSWELHVYYLLTEPERGQEYEARLRVERGVEVVEHGKHVSFVSRTRHHRLRLIGFKVPAFGELVLRAEIRVRGSETWEASVFGWPLVVDERATGTEEPEVTR